MCLYPKLITNPKYKPNIKNKGIPPECKDKRTMLIPVPCGKCMECMKQRGRAWSIRLQEEIRNHKVDSKHFITLTFSNESIQELTEEVEDKTLTGYELDNAIATLAVRRFTERWRKKYKKTIRHWLVTELGGNGTENIHLHGILFTKEAQDVAQLWNYGYVWLGTYVNEATVNYIIKYCTKIDAKHKTYKPKILTSKGIGSTYVTSINAQKNKFNETGETNELYRTRAGYKMNLPTYYKNKIYTEEQREKLWIQKIDKQERWVDGSRVSIAHNDKDYYETLKHAREKNNRLGYGNDADNWSEEKYEAQRRAYLHGRRTTNNRADNYNTTESPPMDRYTNRKPNNSAEIATKWLQKMAKRTQL